jgi:uncharacterized protein YndB with AHSA1/START domain
MSKRTVKHDTIVVERSYKASPKRVFAAWADPNAHGLWKTPGEDWELAESENDFRVGGREMSRFGPKGHANFWSDGKYVDIVPDARIVSAGTMHDGDTRISSTLCTVELLREGSGTRLILTDQSAFFDGHETPADRQSGWGQILDRLGAQLRLEEATV